MIEIEESMFGFDKHCQWLLTDESVFPVLEQLYAQMMGWA